MGFKLGTRSLGNLSGVKPELVEVIKGAISLSKVDFGVPDKATRTLEEQRVLVRRGVSQTMNSKHLIHEDGFGWAADLVPWIGGKFTWDHLDAFGEIAYAMQRAAEVNKVPVTWGAIWDRLLDRLPNGAPALLRAVEDYNARHPGRDFNDYPHMQYGRN